jgi:hypothetical protein
LSRLLAVGQVDEELPVPLRPRKSGVYDADEPRSQAGKRLGNAVQDRAVHVGVAHDSLWRLRSAGLELRLHEHERLPAGLRQPQRRRQRGQDGDEGDVAGDQLGCERQRVERPCVHALQHDHSRIGPKPGMQLPVADVERDHPACSRLQEAVREPACRRSHIEGVLPRRVDPESLDRVGKLLAAPRDEARRPIDLELRCFLDLVARLVVAVDEACEDQCLCLAAALGEPALDEEQIHPFLHE